MKIRIMIDMEDGSPDLGLYIDEKKMDFLLLEDALQKLDFPSKEWSPLHSSHEKVARVRDARHKLVNGICTRIVGEFIYNSIASRDLIDGYSKQKFHNLAKMQKLAEGN